MRLVIFSDTHNVHSFLDVPDGDMLIFAGDMCSYGHRKEAKKFIKWMKELPHEHKVAICGNHDWPFARYMGFAEDNFSGTGIHFLLDSSVTIEGIKIYGSPWQPEFNNWAFNLHRGEELARIWKEIPDDTDILVTHGPPDGILDNCGGLPVGCADLRDRVLEVKPKFHIFGHIHTQYGIRRRDGIVYVNGSIVDDWNAKQNECISLDYDTGI